MRVSLILLALLFPLLGTAQITTQDRDINDAATPAHDRWRSSTAYLTLQLGGAFPTGSFGSNNLRDRDAGYANAGFNVRADYGKTLLFDIVGFSSTMGFSMNGSDIQSLFSISRRIFQGQTVSNFRYKGTREFYTTLGLLIRAPGGERLSIDFRGQVGVAVGIDTKTTFIVTDSITSYEEEFDKATDVNYVIQAGASFRYKLNDRSTLIFSVDWYRTELFFENVNFSRNGSFVEQVSYDSLRDQLTVGVGYGFFFD